MPKWKVAILPFINCERIKGRLFRYFVQILLIPNGIQFRGYHRF